MKKISKTNFILTATQLSQQLLVKEKTIYHSPFVIFDRRTKVNLPVTKSVNLFRLIEQKHFDNSTKDQTIMQERNVEREREREREKRETFFLHFLRNFN